MGQPQCNTEGTGQSNKDISNHQRSEPDGQSTETSHSGSGLSAKQTLLQTASNGPVQLGENNNINCLPNGAHNNNKALVDANHVCDTSAVVQANGTEPPPDG